jgi:hypothetical protein
MKVRVGALGLDLDITPKTLLDYCEKVDFIKSRRPSPWQLLRDIPNTLTVDSYSAFVAEAMKACVTASSSVSVLEEMNFDTSEEGFFYDLWRSLEYSRKKHGSAKGLTVLERDRLKAPEPWRRGIMEAKKIWEMATTAEKQEIRMALNAADQMTQVKNSDGPPESSSNPAGKNPEPPAQA